ncbi:MAG: hypothetical protein WCP38_01925 [Chloroflexota bacterium]
MKQRLATIVTSLALVGTIAAATPNVVAAQGWLAPDSLNAYVASTGSSYGADGSSCSRPNISVATNFPGDAALAIQEAVDLIMPRGTIHLCAGTYRIDSVIYLRGKILTIEGAGQSRTTLLGGATSGMIETRGAATFRDLTITEGHGESALSAYPSYGCGRQIDVNLNWQVVPEIYSTYCPRASTADLNLGVTEAGGHELLVVRTNRSSTDLLKSVQNGVLDESIFKASDIYADEECTGGCSEMQIPVSLPVGHYVFFCNIASGHYESMHTDFEVVAAPTLTVDRSTFTDNSSNNGGAISALYSSITNSTFHSNSAVFGGGAIRANYLTIRDSTFSGNAAAYGGAIVAWSSLDMTGSTFTSNVASGSQATWGGNGGAIVIETWLGTDLRLIRRNTFTENIASGPGGAIVLWTGCGPAVTRAEAARVVGMNRFSKNRGASRTPDIARVDYCD